MPFHFVVNRLGHSMGSFVTPQPIFHFLRTPELIHILAQVQVSLVVRIKLKEGITSSCTMYFCTSTTTTSVPRERTMHKMISAEYT